MRKLLAAAMLIALSWAVISFAHDALAVNVEVVRDDNSIFYGTKISALALTSTRSTGWISVARARGLVLDIAFTDANSSCTAVEMTCETTRDSSTAVGSGYKIHRTTIIGALNASQPMTWCYGANAVCGDGGSAPGSTSWTWIVDDIPDTLIGCTFSATGTPASGDVITVAAYSISP